MRTKKKSHGKPLVILLAITAMAWAFFSFSYPPAHLVGDEQTQPTSVKELVTIEKLVLQLQEKLNRLSRSALNLQIPDWRSKDIFSEKVLSNHLEPNPQGWNLNENSLGLKFRTWPVTESLEDQKNGLALLFQQLFEETVYLDHLAIKLISGDFQDNKKTTFETRVSLNGLFRSVNGTYQSIQGVAQVLWKLHSSEDGNASSWKISQWLQHDLQLVELADDKMFKDVLTSVLPSKDDRTNATRSIHEELVIEMFEKGRANLPGPKFDHQFDFVSSGYHPGVSVVDVDSDGWDDLYVMSRWGKNQLYHNQQDGTFREVASDYGLDIEAHCTSAIFADFDNDGDPDLFLGRSAQPSMYFVNVGGRFVNQSKLISTRLPALVSSISAVDYNNDGLLDVYFSTYGHRESLVKSLLPRHQLEEFARRVNGNENHIYLDGVGAPNLLLMNIGKGEFARAPEADQLEFWQTTFQSTWADYDRDGDADLYVCNDFGPDRLMRNDRKSGFIEVTEQVGHESMTGFGMGASWGDYDLDGLQDLYVSNMYSKAGMRITSNIAGLDPRFRSFASGNRLYRQKDSSFDFISGLKPPKMQVAKAGWSWGGQFTDFDNDGYLDIYVTSGYFTAPAQVATQNDL